MIAHVTETPTGMVRVWACLSCDEVVNLRAGKRCTVELWLTVGEVERLRNKLSDHLTALSEAQEEAAADAPAG